LSFKDVLRRNLGTFQSLADARQMILRWGKSGSFACPAVMNSRPGCANAYRVAKSWKSR